MTISPCEKMVSEIEDTIDGVTKTLEEKIDPYLDKLKDLGGITDIDTSKLDNALMDVKRKKTAEMNKLPNCLDKFTSKSDLISDVVNKISDSIGNITDELSLDTSSTDLLKGLSLADSLLEKYNILADIKYMDEILQCASDVGCNIPETVIDKIDMFENKYSFLSSTDGVNLKDLYPSNISTNTTNKIKNVSNEIKNTSKEINKNVPTSLF